MVNPEVSGLFSFRRSTQIVCLWRQMGRRKIETQRIENEQRRLVTYAKVQYSLRASAMDMHTSTRDETSTT